MPDDFQQKVLEIIRKIPRGKVLTYKKVAQKAKNPRAYRAVGNILNKNKNPKIPCHRVVRSDGEAGGYRKGTKNKIEMLKREGIKIYKSKKVC